MTSPEKSNVTMTTYYWTGWCLNWRVDFKRLKQLKYQRNFYSCSVFSKPITVHNVKQFLDLIVKLFWTLSLWTFLENDNLGCICRSLRKQALNVTFLLPWTSLLRGRKVFLMTVIKLINHPSFFYELFFFPQRLINLNKLTPVLHSKSLEQRGILQSQEGIVMSVGDAFDESLRSVCVTLWFALDFILGISAFLLPNRLISRLPTSSECVRREKAVLAVKLCPLISMPWNFIFFVEDFLGWDAVEKFNLEIQFGLYFSWQPARKLLIFQFIDFTLKGAPRKP